MMNQNNEKKYRDSETYSSATAPIKKIKIMNVN